MIAKTPHTSPYRMSQESTQRAQFDHVSRATFPPQLSGNMFGAKARAAEYNAAKAATARQLACREVDETEPPTLVPMSLCAFTRNTSSNRNRGVKNFIPLHLSEEENMPAVDTDRESNHVLSPTRDPVGFRAASLPPRSGMTILPPSLFSRFDAYTHLLTPYRYPEPTPYAPTAMRAEKFYGYGNTMPIYQHSTHPHFPGQQVYLPQCVTPVPVQEFHHAVIHSESRFRPINRSASRSSPISHETENDASNMKNPTPPDSSVVGQQFFVFGPDDVSPTKIESKEKARKERGEASEHAPAKMMIRVQQDLDGTSDTAMHDRVQQSRKLEELVEAPTHHYTHGVGRPHTTPESTNRRLSLAKQASWAFCAHDGARGSPGPPLRRFLKECTSCRTSVQTACDTQSCLPHQMVGLEDKQILLNTLLGRTSPSVQPVIESGPLGTDCQGRCEKEDMTTPKKSVWPLYDFASTAFLEVRPPHARERQLFRSIKPYLIAGNFPESDAHTFEAENYKRDNSPTWLSDRNENWGQDSDMKTRSVGDIESQTCAKRTTYADTHRHPDTTIAACVDIIQTLRQKRMLGSRPYGPAPEYAIDRSVGSGRNAVKSLYEKKEDEIMVELPRLARDPRHQPQRADSMKSGSLESIPRAFVATRTG